MGAYLQWAVPLALLGVALLAVVLRQRRAQSRRARQTRPAAKRPTAITRTPAQAPASRQPPLANPAKPAKAAQPARLTPTSDITRGEGAVPQTGTAGSIAAQREAAAEALRQARRRAAADAARLEASRLARTSTLEPPTGSIGTAAAALPRPPQPAPPAPIPPVVSAAPQPFGARVTVPALSSLLPSRPASPGLPLTVLVVDDSKVVRIKTSRLLEKNHYRVLLADDGLSAVACLEVQPADLLITDVEMPGLDGFGLTQRLRASPRWAGLPVIMITSANDKHRAEAAAAGVDVLLGKPYDEQTLLVEVQRALARVQRPETAGLVWH